MRSKSNRDISQRRRQRITGMTPAERVALAERLGEEGIASYMVVHDVDRTSAIRRIKATHRLGRRHSSCALADEH